MTLSSVNTIWVLLGAAMVFFMQAGFSLCEAGFTRAKNTGNILMKNLMDFCIGTPCFWLFGFGIMFGAGSAVVGWLDPGITKDYSFITPAGVPLWAFAIFQTVFCATSATIVSGSMAERTKFSAYCIYSACISLFIYPISGHWIWGGGWLSQLGFHDFAGSTAVHMVGGSCAGRVHPLVLLVRLQRLLHGSHGFRRRADQRRYDFLQYQSGCGGCLLRDPCVHLGSLRETRRVHDL